MKTTLVMPVHGAWAVTRRALEALRGELGDERELVVVDDASPDETADRIEAGFPEARMIRNRASEGFGPACNRGAELAAGRYVCFLNSDAIVAPGALGALETAIERHNAGAVVATLLAEDSRVLEAGWAIGRDGVPYPLGRRRTAEDPRWVFRRQVDYGSAACLLVRTSDFRALNGFDDAYAPGYYEDADLCVRLAERGRGTMLEPAAQVVHLEFGSGSSERARALVRRNRERFLERWSERFAHRPFVRVGGPAPHQELALRDAISLTRFLVVGSQELARDVAGRWRAARVTLLGSGVVDADRTIEIADPDDPAAWLEERRFHYSAVLGHYERLQPALRRSQPQAVQGPTEAGGDLVGILAAEGIAPPGSEPRG